MENEKTLVQQAAEIVKDIEGYEVYIVPNTSFFYVVTPSKNVLCIQRGTFGGIHYTFEYVASKEHGTGCSCCDDPTWILPTKEDLEIYEKEGLEYAKRLGAKLFSDPSEFFGKSYWKSDLIKL